MPNKLITGTTCLQCQCLTLVLLFQMVIDVGKVVPGNIATFIFPNLTAKLTISPFVAKTWLTGLLLVLLLTGNCFLWKAL